MKILILANFGMGLYNFRKELLNKLLGDDHEIYVSIPEDEYSNKIREMGCKIINTNVDRRGMNPLKDYKLYRNYKSIFKKINPDVVLTYTIKPNIYGGIVSTKMNIPYIANITGLGTSIEKNNLISKFIIKLYKVGIENANKIFFQNRDNLDFFLKHNIIKNEYHVLPGSGVNLDKFSPTSYKNTEDTNFLYIGRLMESKGINELLEGFNEITNRYSNIYLNIVGFDEEKYEEKINNNSDNNHIIFHGQQSDVKKFINYSDAIIQPSYHEGMSNVLLEGAASGKPLLASNIPGCKEIIDDGINGYLFEPKDTKSLVCSIEKFLSTSSKEKEQMGKNSRLKVEKEFDRNIVVNEYVRSIEYLVGGKKYV